MKLSHSHVIESRRGEQITITVSCTGTDQQVRYRLNQSFYELAPSGTIVFSPREAKTDLELYFEFTEPSGGCYSIEIQGDPAGDLSKLTVNQTQQLPQRRSFQFLGGDETKGDYPD